MSGRHVIPAPNSLVNMAGLPRECRRPGTGRWTRDRLRVPGCSLASSCCHAGVNRSERLAQRLRGHHRRSWKLQVLIGALSFQDLSEAGALASRRAALLRPSRLPPPAPATELPVDHEIDGDKPDANCRQLHGQHAQGRGEGDVHPLQVVQQRRTLVPRHASGRERARARAGAGASGRGREPRKGEPGSRARAGGRERGRGGAQRQHHRQVERGRVEAAAAEERVAVDVMKVTAGRRQAADGKPTARIR